jgi:hypothetical protein
MCKQFLKCWIFNEIQGLHFYILIKHRHWKGEFLRVGSLGCSVVSWHFEHYFPGSFTGTNYRYFFGLKFPVARTGSFPEVSFWCLIINFHTTRVNERKDMKYLSEIMLPGNQVRGSGREFHNSIIQIAKRPTWPIRGRFCAWRHDDLYAQFHAARG